MKTKRQAVILRAVAALAAISLLSVTACSKPDTEETGAGESGGSSAEASKVETLTVFEALPDVTSTVATAAPDARLLAVQMLESDTLTSTPAWAYLLGSPSTGMGYLVYTIGGRVIGSEDYGELKLTEQEWSKVPAKVEVRVDDDEAIQKALDASGAKRLPAGYYMGLLTYKSADDTSPVEAGKWSIWFEPGDSGATADLILVDAKTGKVTVTSSK